MTNDRISDEIARLMDEAFDALRAERWSTVEERARAVMAFDPEHEEASRLLTAARRMLEAGASETALDRSPSSPEAGAAEPASRVPVTPAAVTTAARAGRTGKVARGFGRVALAALRPLLLPLIIPLIVLVGAAVVADQRGVWDADGPLESTGLVDADGLLTRLRISGDDRLVWELPFVGPSGTASGGSGPGGTIAAGVQPVASPPSRIPPQLAPPAPYDVTAVTVMISPFAGDSVLFGFASPDGMVVTATGSRDAAGLPARVDSLTFQRGPVVSTMRLDASGLVTRAEIFDERSGNSSALSFAYAGDTVMMTKHATAEDERPLASLRTTIDPAVAELVAALRELAAAPAPSARTTTPITQQAEPTNIVVTADVVRGDEQEYIEGDRFSVEWELVIPGGYLNVANNRVAWDFRTGPMHWAGDHYEASIPIWRPMSPSDVTSSCLNVQGEAIKTATALNIVGAVVSAAFSSVIAGEIVVGEVAVGEYVVGEMVVGDLVALPFEEFAKLFADVSTLPSSVDAAKSIYNLKPLIMTTLREGSISLDEGLAAALAGIGGEGAAEYLLADARELRERLRDPSSTTSGLMECHVIGQDRFDHETTRQWKVSATVTDSKRQFAGPTGTGIDYDRRSGRHPDIGTQSAYVEVGTSQQIRTAPTLTVDATIVVRDEFLELTLEDLDSPDRWWGIDSRAPEFVTAVSTGDADYPYVLGVSVSGGPGPFHALLSDDRCEIEFSADQTAAGDAGSSGTGEVRCAFTEPGAYEVGIAITDSHGTRVSRLFAVRAIAILEITSITPSVVAGKDAQGITINGRGFLPGARTTVVIDAPFVTVKFLRFVSDTLLIYEVDVSASTPPGRYAAHVIVNGEEATLANALEVRAVAESAALAPSPTATASPAATAAAPAEQFSIARYVDDKDYEYFFVHPTADSGALRRMDLRVMHGFCTGNSDITPAPYTLVRGPFNSRAEAVAAFAAELTDRRTIGLGCYDPVSDLAGSNRGWVYLSGEIANAVPER